jgi:hypothetical protein
VLLAAFLMSTYSATVGAFPWYASGDQIRGAQLMTAEERQRYVHDLQNMRTLEQCHAYMHDHESALETRARANGVTLPPVKGDPCEVMRRMGRFR